MKHETVKCGIKNLHTYATCIISIMPVLFIALFVIYQRMIKWEGDILR
jgi:hypothetical protein